jgi:hypothetical protein
MECLPDDIEGSNACMGGLEDRARLADVFKSVKVLPDPATPSTFELF